MIEFFTSIFIVACKDASIKVLKGMHIKNINQTPSHV
jgi:hypothetical protein